MGRGIRGGAEVYQQILDFWFVETKPESWWSGDPGFDALVRDRYAELLERASRSELDEWRRAAKGRLAEILVLDQFSRNIHRGTARAFAQDPMALALAQEAISAGAPSQLGPVERSFLYMPFMHSESRVIHETAERLFRENGNEDNHTFELRHKAIIDRFGRYPHRNAILGRESTAEEREFLQQPGSHF